MKTKGCGIQQTMTVQEIAAMAQGGMNRQQIADYYGISVRRLNQLFKERNDLLQAFNTGLAQGIRFATGKLMELIDEKNVVSILFFLKCRASWIEQQYVKEKETQELPRVKIFLPHNNRDALSNDIVIESGSDSMEEES